MLIHICCSVDSHFFLQKLAALYPEKKLIGYFYDPNIHPYSEYKLRLMDVQRSCKKLGIKLLEGAYDYEGWVDAVRGFEGEPEKGKRCTICFDNRLANTAKKALEIGENEITTTLLTSPKKSMEQLRENAEHVAHTFGVNVLTPDFRKNGGTNEQFLLAKSAMLYHQNYCGCLYALEVQRENQERLKDELMVPLTGQILPASIEDRIQLYEAVQACEDAGEHFVLRREKFLNYRVLRAYVKEQKGAIIPSHFLFYSTLSRDFTKGKIDTMAEGIGYFNREDILFIAIEKVNQMLKKSYDSVQDLMKNPLSVEEEITIRKTLSHSFLPTLSPIIVVDKVCEKKYEIYLKSETYPDIRENLVKL
ncbi:epoxyqueuosine reductase QueH [Sulfurospirillum sp. 1612]|uniref:epoxyqueuosine reductase QueH n=1 Tax=Sulfurospirillum sp. 1612 TaxID=3094835 RepID=UPI002F931D84